MRAYRSETSSFIVVPVIVNFKKYNITFEHKSAHEFDADAVTEKVAKAILNWWDEGYKQKENEIQWRNRCYRDAAKNRRKAKKK